MAELTKREILSFNYIICILYHPWPCIKKIWFEDETNKCIWTYNNTLCYKRNKFPTYI